MRALVTGASSGLGREIARQLSARGCEVILTARRYERLAALAKELPGALAIAADLSKEEECYRLIKEAGDIDILINNAGFGVFGTFEETPLEEELRLIDTNIRAMHILAKHYYQQFFEKNQGYLLNVASSAAFFAGPTFSSYYASKAYVLRLSQALWKEAKTAGKKLGVTAFCPGPVDTEFNQVAGVRFSIGQISAQRAAKRAVDGMFKKKRVVTPNLTAAAAHLFSHLAPDFLALSAVLRIQEKKSGTKYR